MITESWHGKNENYLRCRMDWLRQVLQTNRDGPGSGGTATERFEYSQHLDDDSLAPPALEILAEKFGLSEYECHLLFLCVAMEFDLQMPRLCAEAQSDPLRPFPTHALAMTLFSGATWDAMSPERPLRKFRLIEIHQHAESPLISAALRADDRVVNYVKGLNDLDDRLSPLVTPVHQDSFPHRLSRSQNEVALATAASLCRGVDQECEPPLVQLLGGDQRSKLHVAECIAQQFGLSIYRLQAELIPADVSGQEALLRLWERETALLPLALYIDANDFPETADNQTSPLVRFLSRVAGVTFLDTPQVRHNLNRWCEIVDAEKPKAAEQRELWSELLDDPKQAGRLASQFSLDVRSIQEIASRSKRQADDENDDHGLVDSSSVWNSCRQHTRPRLDSLAHRIECKATWEDLVLPNEPLEQLREIAAQIKHRDLVYEDWGFAERHNRGLGTSVLFAGSSGTGKTLAAEVLANELRLDLYRIDLSQVVNKYIGQTEKNLRRLFDAADDGGVILFFDEADALFGKRTEVKDAHDRFANIETNYLLQRLESYRGLAVLATNLKSSLDKAYLRRLRFVVDFPVPDGKQREAIWRRAFPEKVPVGRIDFERLSRLDLTGGNIHSIAVNAAFSSADSTSEVGMPHILNSAYQEFRKLQKPVSSSDFRCREKGSARTPVTERYLNP